MIVKKTFFTVSYDLMKPGQSYQTLIKRLEELRGTRVLASVWILNSTATALSIANDLVRFIDGNDRLLVVGSDGSAAWSNLLVADETIRSKVA